MKFTIARYLCAAGIGATLAAAHVYYDCWQFWVITVLYVAYGEFRAKGLNK